jgi:acyl-CoA thioesterase-2
MTSAIDNLLHILDLEQLELNLFRGRSPQVGWQRVFGGQVIGQALMAVRRTVDVSRAPHSLHGYFMRPGDPAIPIIYEVERIRDGKSFTTRRVIAIQHGQAIFAMSASFHEPEPGFEHQMVMPDVPQPGDLPSDQELATQLIDVLPQGVKKYFQHERPIEVRPTDLSRYTGHGARTPVQHIWIRTTGPLPDDLAIHQCVLAYASDMTLLDTALVAHGKTLFDKGIQAASLDHALWFHKPFRADEWLLYAQDSPFSGGARGFTRGLIYTQGGDLVASVAQEGLIRPVTGHI